MYLNLISVKYCCHGNHLYDSVLYNLGILKSTQNTNFYIKGSEKIHSFIYGSYVQYGTPQSLCKILTTLSILATIQRMKTPNPHLLDLSGSHLGNFPGCPINYWGQMLLKIMIENYLQTVVNKIAILLLIFMQRMEILVVVELNDSLNNFGSFPFYGHLIKLINIALLLYQLQKQSPWCN